MKGPAANDNPALYKSHESTYFVLNEIARDTARD
jgi:hypothetical protein